jgi:hypothetical protein
LSIETLNVAGSSRNVAGNSIVQIVGHFERVCEVWINLLRYSLTLIT